MISGTPEIGPRIQPVPELDELSAHGVSARRGGQILFSDVHFSISAGQSLLVRGPNGCGKTTLLRALCGLSELADGEFRMEGARLQDRDETAADHIAYVGHRDGLKDELTPLENLNVHRGLRGKPSDEAICLRALVQAGLDGFMDTPVRYLSQGQRRKTALSRLLASPCSLWILDEPFTALDADAVKWVAGWFRKHLDYGGMLVVTSHQQVADLHPTKILDLG